MFNGGEHTRLPMTDFPGMYLAEIVDDQDTEKPSSGRVKVRVFPMMIGLQVSVLPWAVPAFGLFEGGAANMGAYTVPAIGSRVWVFFSANDVRSPVYFAAAPAMNDGPSGANPNKKIFKTRSGNTITIDDTSGSEQIEILQKNGEKVVLKNGSVELGTSAFKKLVNETFQALFNGHTHPTAGTGPPSPPTQQMQASHLTSDTKAS